MVQSSVGSLLLSSESWCVKGFVCAFQDWSFCLPRFCGSLVIKPTGLQGRFPGDFQSLCWIPRLGCLTWGSEPSQWEMTFLLLLFSSLWVTYLEGMEFDFMVTVSLLLPHCGFFFVFGCLFLVCSNILLLMVVVGREKISQGGMFRLSHPTFCK